MHISDTGEKFGILQTEDTAADGKRRQDYDLILLGDDGGGADLSGDEGDSSIGIETISHRESSGRGDAAGWLARMEGTKIMALKVTGQHEKTKFWDECSRFQLIDEHEGRDWGAMAESWNEFVGEREMANQNDVLIFYRKQPQMLKTFFETGGKNNNIKATLQPHLKSLETLSKDHRATVAAPSTAKSITNPSATHGPKSIVTENKDYSKMVPVVPLNMRDASVLTSQLNGPINYPGQVQQSDMIEPSKRKYERAPRICTNCGHYCQHNNLYNKLHDSKCGVPEGAYNSDRSIKHWCPCTECVAGALKISYPKPVVVEALRALKVCGTCGHYKTIGSFKVHHGISDCRVLVEERVKDIYRGWCSCEKCIKLAADNGHMKPTNLRKK
jgi:hypothetical protein